MNVEQRSGAVLPSTFTTYIIHLFSYLNRYTHYNLTNGGLNFKKRELIRSITALLSFMIGAFSFCSLHDILYHRITDLSTIIYTLAFIGDKIDNFAQIYLCNLFLRNRLTKLPSCVIVMLLTDVSTLQ